MGKMSDLHIKMQREFLTLEDELIYKEMERQHINIKEVDNIIIEGVDSGDYPDFCDAFIASADYNGRECTEDELEYLTAHYPEKVNELAFESLIP